MSDRAVPADPTDAPALVIDNPWRTLRRFTAARIGLGRAGVSLPTAAQLDFQLAHAQARDAVHRPLQVAELQQALGGMGLHSMALHSAAASRSIYLQRPDLGRRLSDASREELLAWRNAATLPPTHDLAIAIVDGLSALAVQRHAVPLLRDLRARLGEGWSIAPVAVVEQGRVAVGDAIGELLSAQLVVVMIGERPGLSSPDSLGLYLTWAPRPGRVDAERNCISNVRPEGLGYADAAARLAYLLEQARERQLTGVALKDESTVAEPATLASSHNFLLGHGPG